MIMARPSPRLPSKHTGDTTTAPNRHSDLSLQGLPAKTKSVIFTFSFPAPGLLTKLLPSKNAPLVWLRPPTRIYQPTCRAQNPFPPICRVYVSTGSIKTQTLTPTDISLPGQHKVTDEAGLGSRSHLEPNWSSLATSTSAGQEGSIMGTRGAIAIPPPPDPTGPQPSGVFAQTDPQRDE